MLLLPAHFHYLNKNKLLFLVFSLELEINPNLFPICSILPFIIDYLIEKYP